MEIYYIQLNKFIYMYWSVLYKKKGCERRRGRNLKMVEQSRVLYNQEMLLTASHSYHTTYPRSRPLRMSFIKGLPEM